MASPVDRWLRFLPAALCAAAGAVVFQFFGTPGRGYIDTDSLFYWWGFQWFNEGSEAEHGPMILVLSGWLFWRNLKKAEFGSGNGDLTRAKAGVAGLPWMAGAALVGGLALHGFGYAVEQARISIVALLIFAWGVLVLAGGQRWGRAAVFPLAFLLFAMPVNFLDSVGFFLRVWVIDATHVLARIAGIEVIRNGTQLFSPDGSYQYDVAAACSGVRSLMALMALTLLTSYLNLKSWWRRAAVFLLCFPLTYLGNVIRISAVIFAGEWLGQEAGVWVHDWAGFLVFVVVLGGVLGAVTLWQKWQPEREPSIRDQPIAASASPMAFDSAGHLSQAKGVWVTTGLVVGLAVVTAGFTLRVDRWVVVGGAGVALAEDGLNPADLPAFIGLDWIGQRTEVSAVEREILPPDTGYSRRNYVSTSDRQTQVFVSVVLSGRDRTSIHRPELCLVGQGWTITGRMAHRFDHPGGGEVPATVLRITREVVTPRGERMVLPALFAYWFVGRDSVEATHGGRLWRTALNRLRGRTDRWAYVVAQTIALDDEPTALDRLQTVLDGTLPALQPGW